MANKFISSKKINSFVKTYLYLLIFILFYFFLLLFFKSKFVFTPDFGESDAFHVNLSLKYFLAESLKNNQLPFWTERLMGGVPLLAESLIGALFLVNIIVLKFIPFIFGYNLLFILSLFFISIGFYLVLREFKIAPLLAFLLSFNFTFNGSIILRLTHLNLIQTFSLFPFLFFVYFRFLKTGKKRYELYFVLILSQMVFAGHIQTVFVSLVGLFLFFCLTNFSKYKNRPRESLANTFHLILLILVGLILALPQILPSISYSSYTSRSLSLSYQNATLFPFSWSNLVNFFSPFIFGNPKFGTYPPFSSDWGIFWENTPYIGVVLFFTLTILLIIAFLRDRKLMVNKTVLISLLSSCFLITLALGKNSPLYLVYNFFPFNLFRTPSKFLIPSVFFIFLAAALVFNRFWDKSKLIKLLISLLLLINLADLFNFSYHYHFFVSADKILTEPPISKRIDDNKYLTIGQSGIWNSEFLSSGWSKKTAESFYLFAKDFLYPDSNLIYGKNTYDVNSPGLVYRRAELIKNLILSGISLKDNKALISSSSKNLMNNYGIKSLILSQELDDNDFSFITKQTYLKDAIYLYQRRNFADNFFYLPIRTTKITLINDFLDLYHQDNNFENNAAVENQSLIKDFSRNQQKTKITPLAITDTKAVLKGYFPMERLMVLKKDYSPDWRAYIDNKEVKIYRINLTHMGILVGSGNHTISLTYENISFKRGLLISISIFLLFLLYLIKSRSKRFDRLTV